MSLWRDTWVAADNPHTIPLAAAWEEALKSAHALHKCWRLVHLPTTNFSCGLGQPTQPPSTSFLFRSGNCCPWFASLITVTSKPSCKVTGKRRESSLRTGLKHHVSHYQYFFCWVFTSFECKDFWFLLCREAFRVVTFGFSLANGCEKSTFFIWTCSFTVKKSLGSERSSKAHFLFQPVTRNRWARSRHTHFRNVKDVGEIFQTATQAGSVPTSHNCHWFPVRCFGKCHRRAHLYL